MLVASPTKSKLRSAGTRQFQIHSDFYLRHFRHSQSERGEEDGIHSNRLAVSTTLLASLREERKREEREKKGVTEGRKGVRERDKKEKRAGANEMC